MSKQKAFAPHTQTGIESLVKKAAAENMIIVAPKVSDCKMLENVAADLGLEIPAPVSVRQLYADPDLISPEYMHKTVKVLTYNSDEILRMLLSHNFSIAQVFGTANV